MRFQINQKDIEFFTYLHGVKVSRRDQIGRDIYPHLSISALYKRLRALEKSGHILGTISSESKNKKAYSITQKAFNRYLLDKRSVAKRKEFSSYALKHDMGLVDIRYKILKSKLVTDFISENTIQTWPSSHFDIDVKPYLRSHSDAIVEITVDGDSAVMALEYEISLKSIKRYQELIRKYHWEYSIPVVLYIVSSSRILEKVMSIEKEMDKQKRGKFFTQHWKNCCKKKGRVSRTGKE